MEGIYLWDVADVEGESANLGDLGGRYKVGLS